MTDYFRGNPQKRSLLDILSDREPIPGHYRNRDDRLAKIDEQGLQAVWMLPSLAMGYEEGCSTTHLPPHRRSKPSIAGCSMTGATTTRTASSVRPT